MYQVRRSSQDEVSCELVEPVNPQNLGDVVREIARKEAEKVQMRQPPPISPIQPDNAFAKLEERIAKLESKVAELEKKSHSH